MDCLITIARRNDRRVVSVAGRLSSRELPEFLEACAPDGGSNLVVDLTDIMSVDAVVAAHLSRLQTEGVTLLAVPPYIQLVLARRRAGTEP